jgi:hypothetical protein
MADQSVVLDQVRRFWEYHDDKVARERIYVMEGWEAPEWRARWRSDTLRTRRSDAPMTARVVAPFAGANQTSARRRPT